MIAQSGLIWTRLALTNSVVVGIGNLSDFNLVEVMVCEVRTMKTHVSGTVTEGVLRELSHRVLYKARRVGRRCGASEPDSRGCWSTWDGVTRSGIDIAQQGKQQY